VAKTLRARRRKGNRNWIARGQDAHGVRYEVDLRTPTRELLDGLLANTKPKGTVVPPRRP